MVRYQNTFFFTILFFNWNKNDNKFDYKIQGWNSIDGHKIDTKHNYPHMSQVHMSTISSFSKDPLNFSNSSFNFISISINSTKLESLLQSTLSSLRQFLLTKIKIFRLSL
jgi:hypothetical protein